MVFHVFSTQPTSTTTVFFGQIRVESRTSSGRGGFSVSQCEAGEPRDRRTVHWWRCMTMHVWSTFLREMTMLIILGPCRANPEFRLFLRCRFCRNWADLRVQKGPPPIGNSQWRFGGESPWWIHIWRQMGWSLVTDVYILFVRPKRCVFADFFWVFEDFSIMIHDDLWFQEFCMTLWNVWKIRWNIDTTGPKRCCISRKTAGFFEGILLILDVQVTFQKMLFKTATFQTRHFLIGETVHVVPETATLGNAFQ